MDKTVAESPSSSKDIAELLIGHYDQTYDLTYKLSGAEKQNIHSTSHRHWRSHIANFRRIAG